MDPIGYPIIDELENAAQCGVESWPSGPVGELSTFAHALYFYQSIACGLIDSSAKSMVSDPRFLAVERHLSARNRALLVDSSRSWGLAAADESGRLVDELSQYALTATKQSPLSRATSHQVISALGEFHSNITEHSDDRERSYIGYEVSEKFVGIYATDLGVGTLASLKRNADFRSLTDHGESLKLAIQDGVSSKEELGRGLGFRPIFEGLANRSGYLRFRSGDALLEMSAIQRDQPSLQVRQRPHIDGFHVYVHCQI